MNITAQQALKMIRWYDVYSSELRDYSDNDLIEDLYFSLKDNYELVYEDDNITCHDVYKNHMFMKTILPIEELGYTKYHEQFSLENYANFKV